MRQLFLADLKERSNEEVLEHLAMNYSGKAIGPYTYDKGAEEDVLGARALLEDKTVLIAYESVGAWGCDSSSFFLLQDGQGRLYEVHGAHCSCYGFEGQLDLEETTLQALKFRLGNDGILFSCGGYDDECDENHEAAKKYIFELE